MKFFRSAVRRRADWCRAHDRPGGAPIMAGACAACIREVQARTTAAIKLGDAADWSRVSRTWWHPQWWVV